jgi:sugar phosphate isomerase/epimerase
MKLAIETYTVRKEMRESMGETFADLISLGFTDFELARIKFNDKNADEIALLQKKYPINILAIQVKPNYLSRHIEEIASFCKKVSCKNIVVSKMPFRFIWSSDQKFKDYIVQLNLLADTCSKLNITLAYHHHYWEFVKLKNGKTKLEEIFDNTANMKFVCDTYWTAKCGVNPSKQIEYFNKRLLGVHLRDINVFKKNFKVKSDNCPLGQGFIDFKSVFKKAQQAGAEYMAIELKSEEPMLDIESSKDYLIEENLITQEGKIKEKKAAPSSDVMSGI